MFLNMANHIQQQKERSQHRQPKQQKEQNGKVIPIEADISAINGWLLEICHFMLDNYQLQIKDNLIHVKQPPGIELLELAKKGLSYPLRYETIPEYIFKDF